LISFSRQEGNGNSVLLESVRFQRIRILSYLVLELISPYASMDLVENLIMPNKLSQDPISMAIQSKNEEIVSLFLTRENSFSKSIPRKSFENAFFKLIRAGMEKMAIKLISKDPERLLNLISSEGESLLNVSVSNNCLELTKELLKRGANPLYSIEANSLQSTQPDSLQSKLKSPFIMALNQSLQTVELISIFLEFSKPKLFLGIENQQQQQQLIESLSLLNVENGKAIISKLLEYGLNLHSTELLIESLKGGNKSLSILLINEFKFDPNTIDKNGISLFHHASRLGMVDIMDFLFEKGVDINSPEKEKNQTPLMYASYFQRIPVVGWLMEHGARIDLQDKDGKTALLLRPSGEIALLLTRFVTYSQSKGFFFFFK